MRMRELDSVPLAVGKPLQLKPGGYHLMLMDLKAPFKPGSHIPMTLRFRDAKGQESKLAVSVPVSAAPPTTKH
jgi:copper(I)-binding protein